MNEGKFDGGQLTEQEKDLRDFYKRLLNFTINSSALMGNFQEIQSANRNISSGYDIAIYSYVRWSNIQKLIMVTNFYWLATSNFELRIPTDIIEKWNLQDGEYTLTDQLYGISKVMLQVENGEGRVKINIGPSESFIYELSKI
jgi:hypothetical protein